MLQRCREAAAHDVAEYVEDHDVGIFEEMVFFEELDGLTDHIAAATRTGRRAAGLDAHDAVIPFEGEVFDAQLFGVKIHGFEHVDDGRHQTLGQRESRVMLRIAADLQHALAELGKSHGQIRRRRALADTALAVNGKHLCVTDLQIRIEWNLHAALAVGRSYGAMFERRYRYAGDVHAATPS
jgi:hypothetical protein